MFYSNKIQYTIISIKEFLINIYRIETDYAVWLQVELDSVKVEHMFGDSVHSIEF